MNEHDNLPGLAFLAACWNWVEQFLLILSIPMLVFGATVTVVDLLTDGATTLAAPWLVVGWAVSQGLGIESNISGSIHKARAAFERASYVVMILYILLCLALGSVIVVAGYVYSYHQTRGIPISQSLADLGIDPAAWVLSRSLLAFLLIAISVLTHYRGKQKLSTEEKLAAIQEKLLLQPYEQQLNEGKVHGARKLVAAARGKAYVPPAGMGVPAPTTVPQYGAPSNPGDTPFGAVPWGADLAEVAQARGVAPARGAPSLSLVARDGALVMRRVRTPRPKAKARKPKGADSWRDLAQVAWDNGARTVKQLERAVVNADGVHISHGAAQYWRGVFMAYAAGQSSEERAEA